MNGVDRLPEGGASFFVFPIVPKSVEVYGRKTRRPDFASNEGALTTDSKMPHVEGFEPRVV